MLSFCIKHCTILERQVLLSVKYLFFNAWNLITSKTSHVTEKEMLFTAKNY